MTKKRCIMICCGETLRDQTMLNRFREIFERAIYRSINEKGVDALKRTSLFGSNDPAAWNTRVGDKQ